MVHANFINLPDNVPFVRVYKSVDTMKAAVRRMKNAVFLDAVDFKRLKIYKPSDLN